MRPSQSTDTVLMIRPVRFQFNPETASSNRFQRATPLAAPHAEQQAALQEFEGLQAVLRDARVCIVEYTDTSEPHSPDSIFPNNWISTHSDGRVATYPMQAANRRVERRDDLVAGLSADHGLIKTQRIDFSQFEQAGKFLEGTGSMVLDRVGRIAYAALSERTHPEVLAAFADEFDYTVQVFTALDRYEVPIYHTNVMMCIGTGFVAVCLEAIAESVEREALLASLQNSGRELCELSFEQVEAFAGNMLELQSLAGDSLLAMSSQAHAALRPEQRQLLSRHCRLIHAPIPTIEALAGGSVRCMLAELFLPRRPSV